MHRLFGAFVRAQVPTSKEAGLVERLHLVQRTRAVEAAKAFVEQPRRTDFATALLVFPLGPPEWDAGGAPLDIEGGEALGEALCVMGHFEEARPWFERAVAAKEKGDVHGRVDNERLGSSLHQVGTDQNATALK